MPPRRRTQRPTRKVRQADASMRKLEIAVADSRQPRRTARPEHRVAPEIADAPVDEPELLFDLEAATPRDETIMGFGFPRDEREALMGSEPDKFLMPRPSDMRYQWVCVRLDAWRMCVPKEGGRRLRGLTHAPH